MTSGIKSHTTKIGIGDGASPETFSNITEVYSIGPVGGTKDLIDMSSHDTENIKDQVVADLAEGDEIECMANEIPGDTNQDLVRTAYDDSTKDNWKVTYRGGSYELFPGLVLMAQTDPSELDGKVIFRFRVKIAGAITRYTGG